MKPLFLPALAIFLATLFLVTVRPKNLPIGYSATAGAILCLLLGITKPSDILLVWSIVWNATFTFVAIVMVSLVFDEAGFFEYLAMKIAKIAGGNRLRLFILIILMGAGVSAVFANDGTALIITPIIYTLLKRVGITGRQALPFIVSVGFIADSASLPLVVSNLVNIVASSYFGISFLGYAQVMIPPDLAAITSSLILLWLYYRRSVTGRFSTHTLVDPANVIRDPLIFKAATPSIIMLILAYSLGGFYGVPVAYVAVPTAVIVLGLTKLNKKINALRIIRTAPWQIVVFSLGMYLIVFGLGREGLTQLLSTVLGWVSSLGQPLSTLLSGFFFALLAASMNNMPSVMLGNLAISRLGDPTWLVYANVVGNDIGPKFTPIGSLATLLWLYMLDRKGDIRVTVYEYMKVGVLIALPVLFFTLITLWVTG
ncbi:arsenical efflux pump membrane protein ArsB [Candidatus Marsarchaeota G2 archaeon ECH_B_SAG-C16]|uniref:Arsenical efflux pump membrane protein ArsB n=1 Tax=Candidatus Marsarchaeota G2 archaeon ECH_B_SAG-C16 TaxID=1978163 RepID=A0A2R6BFE0_9ARCH|nr:MAG: arsenical efflux pump membrane protein ArsB [Candidatus Marsarchaeota G2 archaeon ECH_B_SAG-C16]